MLPSACGWFPEESPSCDKYWNKPKPKNIKDEASESSDRSDVKLEPIPLPRAIPSRVNRFISHLSAYISYAEVVLRAAAKNPPPQRINSEKCRV